MLILFFFFSSRRRHTRCGRDWSSDVCASPSNNTLLSKFHGLQRMVTNVEVGFSKKSFVNVGILARASGNVFSKNATTFSSVSKLSKEVSPFIGKKSVTVKLLSKFGKAININSPRGHICKQFLSKQCVPSGLAGKLNSLYPCGRYSCA